MAKKMQQLALQIENICLDKRCSPVSRVREIHKIVAEVTGSEHLLIPEPARCRHPENGGGGHVEYCSNVLPCREHER